MFKFLKDFSGALSTVVTVNGNTYKCVCYEEEGHAKCRAFFSDKDGAVNDNLPDPVYYGDYDIVSEETLVDFIMDFIETAG